MKRGFHLIDGMLACGIILVSIQGSLLLSQKARQVDCLAREKAMAWEVMRKMRQFPAKILRTQSAFDFTYTGEATKESSFYRVEVQEIEAKETICYQLTLSYRSSTGEELTLQFKRWEVRSE